MAAVPVFLHPTHNVAIVKYNPADLAGTSVATARLSPVPLHVGDECMFVGLSKLDAALPVFQPCSVRETCVMEVISSTLSCSNHAPSRKWALFR